MPTLLASKQQVGSRSTAGQVLTPALAITSAKKTDPADELRNLDYVNNLSPSLAAVLRPQAAYRWLLPYLSAITPTYIESVLRGGLAGNHVQMWELFDLMIDTDPEIGSCVEEYNEGITSKRIVVDAYAEEDEPPSDKAKEKQRLISAALRGMRPDMANDENTFRDMIRDILSARFHGQSVLEMDYTMGNGDPTLNICTLSDLGKVLLPRTTYWVHPVCYAWSMEGRLGLRVAVEEQLRQISQYGGFNKTQRFGMVEPPAWNWIASQPMPSVLQEFPENKFLIGINKSKTGSVLSSSVLRKLAWWWVASNFCGDYLLNYAQLFGIPFRKAKYKPSTSEAQKAEIRQMLQSCGSAGYILLPDVAELEFMEAGSGAGQSPQAFLFHFADSQKRKVILHQTMTGGQHGAAVKGVTGAFGEVEADTKSVCLQAGADFAASVINLQFVPAVLNLNYGEGGDLEAPTVKLVDLDIGGLQDAQRDAALAQIMDVPESYLRRRYGIPKPQAGEEIAGKDAGILAAQADFQQQQHDDQMDAAKENAKALAKAKANQPAPAPGQPGPQQKLAKEEGEEDSGTQARNALLDKPLKAKNKAALKKAAAKALRETVQPILDRLKAIAAVEHTETRQAMLKKFLADKPKIAAALAKDDTLARTVTPDLVAQFVSGLHEKGRK
jgi:phage gp29-like protein